MYFKSPRRILAVAAVSITTILGVNVMAEDINDSAVDAKKSEETTNQDATINTAVKPVVKGRTAYIDPETGKFTSPPPADSGQQLIVPPPAMKSVGNEYPVTKYPDGSASIDTSTLRVFLTLDVDCDGNKTYKHKTVEQIKKDYSETKNTCKEEGADNE